MDLQLGAPAVATGYDVIPEAAKSVPIVSVLNKPIVPGIPAGAREKLKDDGEIVYRPYKSDIQI